MPPRAPCPACGQIMSKHERCAACRALAGYRHNIDRLYEGRWCGPRSAPAKICVSCIAMRDRTSEGAAQVAAAIGRNSWWE